MSRNRCREPSPEQQPVDTGPRSFFVGATHPEQAGARELEVGGAEERLLLEFLESWVESVVPAETHGAEMAAYARLKTEQERSALLHDAGLTETQARALRVYKMIAAHRRTLESFTGE